MICKLESRFFFFERLTIDSVATGATAIADTFKTLNPYPSQNLIHNSLKYCFLTTRINPIKRINLFESTLKNAIVSRR